MFASVVLYLTVCHFFQIHEEHVLSSFLFYFFLPFSSFLLLWFYLLRRRNSPELIGESWADIMNQEKFIWAARFQRIIPGILNFTSWREASLKFFLQDKIVTNLVWFCFLRGKFGVKCHIISWSEIPINQLQKSLYNHLYSIF